MSYINFLFARGGYMIPKDSFYIEHKENLKEAHIDPVEQNQSKVSKQVDKCKFIILSGTSTSGKSSIMSAFCKNNADATQLGVDDFATEIGTPNLIKNNLPDDYKVLSEAFLDRHLLEVCNPDAPIVSLLQMRPDLFKPDASQEQRNAAIELLEKRGEGSFSARYMQVFNDPILNSKEAHFNAVLEKFKEDKTVIFDTCFPGEFFTFMKDNGIKVEEKVQHILVYLPLDALLERAEGRNKAAISEGRFADVRTLIGVMGSFMEHYVPVKKEKDVTVAKITRDEIKQLFNKYSKQIEKENEGREDKLTFNYMLAHFGFSDATDQVSITTKFRVPQEIFNTSNQEAADVAHQLSNNEFKKL